MRVVERERERDRDYELMPFDVFEAVIRIDLISFHLISSLLFPLYDGIQNPMLRRGGGGGGGGKVLDSS
jgi:hypothetical protein